MKRSRPMYRRALAVAGSAVIGLIGAVALGSPASAHHTEVSGVPVCDTETGEWVVTWTVDSFAPADAPTYRLLQVEVTPVGSWVSNIEKTKGQDFPHASGTPLVGEQRLAGDATSASLGVRAQWSNKFEEKKLRTGEVKFEGTCEKPPAKPDVNSASTCDELTVTVTNPEDGAAVTVQITPSVGEQRELTLEPGASESVGFPAGEGLTFEVTLDGAVIGSGAWEDPGDCEVEIPVAARSDCDSLTIEITNPLEDEAIEATVRVDDVADNVIIEPGETAEVSFGAAEGTTAIVTIGDESIEIPWEEPDDCDGGGGGLPVTGAPTGVVIGAALALLAVGGGLFLLARRRRITFTA